MGKGIQLQIDQERSGGAAVRYQVSHQGFGEVRVDFHDYSNRCYSKDNCHFAVWQLIPAEETGILPDVIKRIKFIGIPVRDQDRALGFYTGKLGFRILTDQQFTPTQRWIELSIPGAETGIALFTPEGHEDRVGTFVNTSWEVDDVQKTYEELVAKGVEFSGAPVKQAWGTSVVMKDSENNSIVLGSR
jgi:catechol 2,3-dioxygenase-like lactoylglutathione lyase family enzyme